MGPQQVSALVTALITLCLATPPPGYVKKLDSDKNPPKYEFGYDVRDGKGGRQGHLETRDGIYALGVYYVNLPDGSGQSVRYFVDDWGYHPLVSYTSATNTGSTKTHFALGEKAVAALAKSKQTNSLISVTSPTVPTVSNSQLKTPTGADDGSSTNDDILNITPIKSELSSNSFGGIRKKVSTSYQQVSYPSEEQAHDSEVRNRVESNGGSDNRQYKVVTPLYSTSQRISDSNSPSSSNGSDSPEKISDYETEQEYQPTGTKETGSFSYQLLEIGGDSSGTDDSGSVIPLILPTVTESANHEREKTSDYKDDKKFNAISYISNENSALKFGDRIPNVSTDLIQTIGKIQKDQNEIHKEKEEGLDVTTSLPILQRHNLLRPIIVADIYTKENKEKNEISRPIVILPNTTPASVHESHSPESPTLLFSDSGSKKSGSIVTSKQEDINVHPSTTNALPNIQAVSLAHSAGSDSISNNKFSGNVLSQAFGTQKPLSVSYTKDVTATQYLSGREGGLSNSTGFVDEGLSADAESLLTPTPAPVVVPYQHDISGAQELLSQAKFHVQEASNTQQVPSPVYIYYSPISTYLQESSSKMTKTSNINRPIFTGVYSTPLPLSLSRSQGSLIYSSSGKEENVPGQAIMIDNNGEAGNIIKSENLSPISDYISNSPKSAQSDSIGSSGSPASLTTINNADSGQIIADSFHSTTPPPAVISLSSSEALSSEGYVVGPGTILHNLKSQPTAALLSSSSEVLAPTQAGVSLGTISQKHPTTLSDVISASTVTSQPPQAKEESEGIAQPRTVVEVQKAVSLDFHSLALKSDEYQKPNSIAPTTGTPISYSQVLVEGDKQPEHNNGHQINTGNLIEYSYGQPLTGMKLYPKIAFSLPVQIGSAEQVLYDYNPQIFESQNLPPQRSQGSVQQGARYEPPFGTDKEEQQRRYTQKQNPGLSQTIQAAENGNTGAEYQFNQQLDGNSQTYQRLNDIENQQETTAYNQQSNIGVQKILKNLIPEVIQSVQKEAEVKKYQAILQTDKDLNYQEPFEITQKIQKQSPIDISQQLTYKVLGQQENHKEPLEFNQQIEFLTPVYFNAPVEEAVNAAALHFGYTFQDNFLPGLNQHVTHKIAHSTNQSQLAYTSPRKITEQLNSEYNHQLLEEERQEEVRLSNEIGKVIKQVRTEHEGGAGTHTIKEEVISLPVDINIPALPPTTVVPIGTAHQVLELEKPVDVEHTKLVTVEKPVPVHYTRTVEKPIAVPHPVPVEITKLVPVDRPVPFPQPFAVPHPVPVPYAVPHPIGVPVPHLIPYPHLVTAPYKDLHPIYFRNGKPHKNELALYGHQFPSFPSNTPLPIILKAMQYNGGRYGEPVSVKHHRFKFSRLPQPVYLTPPPLKSSGRELQQTRNFDNLRTLCVEYGFKPPLVPSLQIEEIPPSAFGPHKKD